MKWIFLLLMIAIFFYLFKGLFHLLKEGGQSSTKVVRSLTIRVGLTILFFAGLYIADYFGYITGHRLDQVFLVDKSRSTASAIAEAPENTDP